MIKNCKVLINNEAVTVIDYDGREIQIPSIKKNTNFVRVIKKSNNYIVVDDSYIEPASQNAEKPKKASKKTTTKESVNKNPKPELIEKENKDA